MAIYCIDYINGVNSPGGGTSGAPWKNIAYAITQITLGVGDEFRIHAGADPTLLDTGAFKTTALSFTITTSINLTGSLAANDYIFIGDDKILPYRISSITSTTITLYSNQPIYPEYFGNGVTFNIWKAGGVPVVINASTDVFDTFAPSSSFTINSDSVIISGGWDSTFAAKTEFGKTLFYRTTTTAFNNNNISLGSIFRNTQNAGYVFKDFNVTGYFTNFIVSSGATTLLCANQKIDNCVFSSWNFNVSGGSKTTTSDGYFTNCTMVSTSLSSTSQCSLQNNVASTGIYYLNNLTNYVTGRFVANTSTTFRISGTTSSALKMVFGNLKLINRYSATLWGGTALNIPDPWRLSTLAGAGSLLYSNYLKVDNLILEGYPCQLNQVDAPGGIPMRRYIPLTTTNLSQLISIGATTNGRQTTITAPGDPFSTASGSYISPDQDSGGRMNSFSVNPVNWIDTNTQIMYYIYGQGVMYLNTTDYVTGSNSLAIRPASVGNEGNVFGFSCPIGSTFYKKSSETATITIKMKLIGNYGPIPNIRLWSGSTTNEASSYPQDSGSFAYGNGVIQNPSVNPTSLGWTDVVYTFPADTTLALDEMIGYKLYLTEGESGSRLAEAGKWLLVDSVNILIS